MSEPLPDGFLPELQRLKPRARAADFFASGEDGVLAALRRRTITPLDFAALLSPAAGRHLEALAGRAREETLRHFGRAVQLFAPLYLANYCTNRCVYCGFHAGSGIARRALSGREIEAEAKALAATGLRRVLCLTGDAPARTGAEYIAEAVSLLARFFPSVGIEVQALDLNEYGVICRAGADSMTLFQETYDADMYARLHPAGPKRDFTFRLDAPHRASLAGMRAITLGVLLGLGDWRFDVFMLGLHAAWLSRHFPELEIAFSLPRLRPTGAEGTAQAVEGAFLPRPVPDAKFVQALTALRSFLPHAGITLSSRESAFLRDKLVPLGVTRLSAGVRTSVGGYAAGQGEDAGHGGADTPTMVLSGKGDAAGPVQFVIDDDRSVAQMEAALRSLGYQPVFADWLLPEQGDLPLAPGLLRSLALNEGQGRV